MVKQVNAGSKHHSVKRHQEVLADCVEHSDQVEDCARLLEFEDVVYGFVGVLLLIFDHEATPATFEWICPFWLLGGHGIKAMMRKGVLVVPE